MNGGGGAASLQQIVEQLRAEADQSHSFPQPAARGVVAEIRYHATNPEYDIEDPA